MIRGSTPTTSLMPSMAWVEDAVSEVFHSHYDASAWARMLACDAGSLWRVSWREIAEGWMEA